MNIALRKKYLISAKVPFSYWFHLLFEDSVDQFSSDSTNRNLFWSVSDEFISFRDAYDDFDWSLGDGFFPPRDSYDSCFVERLRVDSSLYQSFITRILFSEFQSTSVSSCLGYSGGSLMPFVSSGFNTKQGDWDLGDSWTPYHTLSAGSFVVYQNLFDSLKSTTVGCFFGAPFGHICGPFLLMPLLFHFL